MDNQKTVLLVDDDVDLLEQVRSTVAKDYAVEVAYSGAEALKKVAERKFDCIVMDVMMGSLSDGLDTAKILKEDPDTKAIPVIMLTSVNEHYDYRTQIDEDFFPRDKWIDKPVDPKVLLSEIKRLVK